MPEKNETEWATIGKVVALFGVRGELKVRPLTDIPNRFAELGAVYLGSQHTRYAIQGARPYRGGLVILKLAGINDANAAEAWINSDLQIPLSELAQLPSATYYQHDILGLRVYTLDGRDLGTIAEIMTTGSNDVYVIKAPDGSEILIPAIKDVVKQVDLGHHVMYIDAIPGLLETLDEPEAAAEDDGEGEEA